MSIYIKDKKNIDTNRITDSEYENIVRELIENIETVIDSESVWEWWKKIELNFGRGKP